MLFILGYLDEVWRADNVDRESECAAREAERRAERAEIDARWARWRAAARHVIGVALHDAAVFEGT
jgi:hypothetical protein